MHLPLSVLAILAGCAAATAQLNVTLSWLGNEDIGTRAGDLLVLTTIINAGPRAVKLVVDPRSILSSSPGDKFNIKGPSRAPEFLYPSLQPNRTREYHEVQPSEVLEVFHNLGNSYNFSISGAGQYMITTKNPILYIDEIGGARTAFYHANVIRVTLRSPPSFLRHPLGLSRRGLDNRISIEGFSETQGILVAVAAAKASVMIHSAVKYLEKMANGGDDVIYEFGRRDPQRLNLVTSIFRRILDDPTQTDYYHRCVPNTSNAAAEICRALPHQMYITDRFFEQPQRGLDSQAGTIVHEQTHCNKNCGGTDDIVYGVQPSRLLAETDPDRAVRNADNYQYFAEEVHGGGLVARMCNYLCSLAACCHAGRKEDEYST